MQKTLQIIHSITSSRKRFASAVCILIFVLTAGFVYTLVFAPAIQGDGAHQKCICLDEDDTPDSVCVKSGLGWRWKIYSAFLSYHLRPGRYDIEPGMTCLQLYRHLRNGMQVPMRLTLPTSRTMNQLAKTLSEVLMLDSATIASALTDSMFCAKYGYTTATIPALFIPNTYEVYWDISLEKFMERMVRENGHFWTPTREAKAQECGLTHVEIATLASIVDEETANSSEKPMIAGLYLNRLHNDIPLQADPTVKFAVGDFTLRRIMNKHLQTDSPYNTYKVTGLPPGPIRIASIAGIDAVLNHTKHDYLYMCAKEDFSGTHNFAATYSDHLKNAHRYAQALNQRGIQ